jgi:hypothetical protein
MNRRHFVRLTSGTIAGAVAGLSPLTLIGATVAQWDPTRPLVSAAKTLSVQPVLMYRISEPKPQASWKSWGGAQTEPEIAEEVARISGELASLARQAEFPLQVRPVLKVKSIEEARALQKKDHDVLLLYACTGSGELLQTCFAAQRDTLVFLRHRSGPVYYWYEALSVKYLDTSTGPSDKPRKEGLSPVHVDDVVVDDYGEVLWKLRALSAAKNLLGTKIVALGGPWGKYAPEAPQVSRNKFKMDIIEVSYDQLAKRIQAARNDQALTSKLDEWTNTYLALPQTTLKTERKFVRNAFLLYSLFKEMMAEHAAPAFTVKSCMGTIIPMSETTACLALSLLNDEGLMAFCESDFVIIPAGILLRHIARKPVFLHNSTFPHQRIVTCAHCTGPRRMDGEHYCATQILTHYESEYGAAPKVEIPIGTEVSFIDPEYSVGRWLGFKGVVKGNPGYDICRSQQDVEIQGRWEILKREVRDSHWMMVYGDCLREAGYAARKLGMEWVSLSEA